MTDADAGCDDDASDRRAIVTQLERRCGIKEVKAIVDGAGNAERLTKPAGAAGKPGQRGSGGEAAIVGHGIKAGERLKRAEQDTAGASRGLAGDIHAEVAAIDRVDIGVRGRPKENLIPGVGPR